MDADGIATSSEVAQNGDTHVSPSTKPTLDVLPEVKSLQIDSDLQSGVSTKYALLRRRGHCPDSDEVIVRWHALRTTYGREREASSFITACGGTAYCPTISNVKLVNGKRRKFIESYVPNLLFAYGSIEELKEFVYDNVNMPFLRFYYGFREVGGVMQKRPLFVPNQQMEYLKKICEAEAGGAFIPQDKIKTFKVGDRVRVMKGSKFEGIEGHVARYKGQQCVAVIVEGLLTVSTAYVPTFLLEKIDQ